MADGVHAGNQSRPSCSPPQKKTPKKTRQKNPNATLRPKSQLTTVARVTRLAARGQTWIWIPEILARVEKLRDTEREGEEDFRPIYSLIVLDKTKEEEGSEKRDREKTEEEKKKPLLIRRERSIPARLDGPFFPFEPTICL